MTSRSADDGADDSPVVRGAVTDIAAIEENLDLDENDLSRTTTPATPDALEPERTETAAAVEKPYSAFGEGKKWFIVTLAAVGATTS